MRSNIIYITVSEAPPEEVTPPAAPAIPPEAIKWLLIGAAGLAALTLIIAVAKK